MTSKWTKVFARPHRIQRVSFLWPFLKTGIPQNRSIKANEMLILPFEERHEYYLKEDEWKAMLEKISEHILSQSIDKQLEEFENVIGEYLEISKKVADKGLTKWSNPDLIKWFKEYSKAYESVSLYAFVPWAVDYIIFPKIVFELERIDKNKSSKWLEAISKPTKYSSAFQQNIDLLKIAISKDFNKIKEHTEKHYWLSVYNIGDKQWTEKDFLNQIKEIENPEEELKKKEQELEKRKREYNKTLKEINPKKDLLRMIETAHLYTYLRDERGDKWRQALCNIYHFYYEVARRYSLNAVDVTNMFDEEIVSLLEKNIVPENLEKRKEQHAILYKKGKLSILIESKDIENLRQQEFPIKKSKKEIELRGMPAFKGKVKAIARVISSQDELSKIKKGEVLVAHHTTPAYIMAMKQASAIVTDEGGITSHAAIVSRELKIPCITATQEASKIIKTGDLIEVDADKGIVKILEKSNGERRSLARKFLDVLNGGDVLALNGNFIPLFVLNEWINYYDVDGTKRYLLPIMFIKNKGKAFGYINDTHYAKIGKDLMKATLEGKYDIKKMEKLYVKSKNKIDKTYSDYTRGKIKADLKRMAKEFRNYQDMVAATLFIERLDKRIVEQVIMDLGLTVRLDRIWDASQTLDFENFELKNYKAIAKNYRNPRLLRYIYTTYFHIPSEEEVENEISKYNVQELREEIKKEEDKIRRNKEKLREKLSELSTKEKEIVKYLKWAIWSRDDRKEFISKCDLNLYNLAGDLFEQWGIERDLAKHALVSEVLEGRGCVIRNLDNIRARKDDFELVYFGGEFEEGRENLDKEFEIIEEYLLRGNSKKDELTGDTASLGKFIGKARIVLGKSQFSDFKDGEVLVTGMTRPEFVPLMKKAGAIITDEGGLTCHASIVSRELGTICIVGTKIATQVLKDGDLVEVDANTGTIKILKKAH